LNENGGITTISGFEDEDPDTIIDKDFRYMLMMLSLSERKGGFRSLLESMQRKVIIICMSRII
jgi:hypothetical protein